VEGGREEGRKSLPTTGRARGRAREGGKEEIGEAGRGRDEGGRNDVPPDALEEEEILLFVHRSERAPGMVGMVGIESRHPLLLTGGGPHVKASFL